MGRTRQGDHTRRRKFKSKTLNHPTARLKRVEQRELIHPAKSHARRRFQNHPMNPVISIKSEYLLNANSESAASGLHCRPGKEELGGNKRTIFVLSKAAPSVSPPSGARAIHPRPTFRPFALSSATADDAQLRQPATPTRDHDAPTLRHARIIRRLVTIFSEDQARQVIPIHHQQPTTKE